MKATTNAQTGYLCHCLRITLEDYEDMIRRENFADFATLKARHGVGSMCSSCEYEAKGILLESAMLGGAPAPAAAPILAGRWWHRLLGKSTPKNIPAPGRNYHTGIFFIRHAGLESRLALSNLAFPEHLENVNGHEVSFRAELFGDEGQKLASSQPKSISNNTSQELGLTDLFPDFQGDFVGSLYVYLENLQQTGSLRPYGILTANDGKTEARCHYHDKFGHHPEPGFVQNSSPFEPGQTCWMAVANCQNLPYETAAFLKADGETHQAQLSIPPMGSRWIKLADWFPELAKRERDPSAPALFWLENPQHVMVYFFWFNEAAQTWTGQHH